jgi:hypothetical protein
MEDRTDAANCARAGALVMPIADDALFGRLHLDPPETSLPLLSSHL